MMKAIWKPVGRFVEGDSMLNGKHILIENCPGMGDLIMCTPAFKRLKELYPDCVLSVVSYTHNLDIIAGLPYIDHVYGITKGKFLGHFRPALHFREQDYVIFTSWQPQLARMAQILRVPHRAGVCKDKYSGTGLFNTELPNYDFNYKGFKADLITHQVSLALGVDLSNDGVCEVAKLPQQELNKILENIGVKQSKYVVMAPFANTTQDMPINIISEVTKHLYDNRLTCVFINSEPKHDISLLAEQYGAYDLCGKTNVREMIALLQGAVINIVVDSGPMHVSAALGVPTVSVFSTGNRYMWQPRKNCYAVTVDKSCAPCVSSSAEKCVDKPCINEISAKIICDQVRNVLDNQS